MNGFNVDGNNRWFLCYLVSILMVLMLDGLRQMGFQAADIMTNLIVFLGVNYITNELE